MSLSDLLFESAISDLRDNIRTRTLQEFIDVFDPGLTAVGSAFGSDFLEEARTELLNYGVDGIAVESAFSPAIYKDKHVIISIVCETTDPTEPMGRGQRMLTYPGDPGDPPTYKLEFGCPVQDMIGVYIMAPNRPILRVLDLLIKSNIYGALQWFVSNGTSGPRWVRTSDLAPVTHLVGTETVLKYVRKQTWAVFSNLNIRPFGGDAVVPKNIVVHATGTIVTSVVDPETRVVTPLTSTSVGQVEPKLG